MIGKGFSHLKNKYRWFFTCFLCNFLIATISHASPSYSAWIEKALKLQRAIDLHAPLNEATFIGTHNSYNSKYYANSARYIDPNQLLSITDQLETGIRSLEFDVHWTTNKNLLKDLLLCHAGSNHIGCSLFDRKVIEGLEELRNWLKENPNEIVLLYIDRYLNGHEPRFAALLDQYLGQYIYQPSVLRKPNDKSKGCIAIPSHLTKATILDAGKQLIIVAKRCDGQNPRYEEQDQFKQIWNDYVFAGIGDIPSKPYTFIDATVTHFTAYPDCGKTKIFYPDLNHTSLWRIYEDRTLGGSIQTPQKKLEADGMHELMKCGINWPTMDKLEKNDARLQAAIWSWAPFYPKEGNGSCVIYKKDEGFKNMPCTQTKAGYACQETGTHTIKAISMIGTWLAGESICQMIAGKNWHFAVPVNGAQLDKLKLSMNTALLQEVWLNNVVDGQENWKTMG